MSLAPKKRRIDDDSSYLGVLDFVSPRGLKPESMETLESAYAAIKSEISLRRYLTQIVKYCKLPDNALDELIANVRECSFYDESSSDDGLYEFDLSLVIDDMELTLRFTCDEGQFEQDCKFTNVSFLDEDPDSVIDITELVGVFQEKFPETPDKALHSLRETVGRKISDNRWKYLRESGIDIKTLIALQIFALADWVFKNN